MCPNGYCHFVFYHACPICLITLADLHIKPFGCNICNVRLASKHNLLSHVKTRLHKRAAQMARGEADSSLTEIPQFVEEDDGMRYE
jgi:Zinc-finger of C2H2 type